MDVSPTVSIECAREILATVKPPTTNCDPQLSPPYADLNAPPDRVPAHPPVTTRPQVLPFGELTWENFERLCSRLAGQDERVEYAARYGRSGQAQQGIDLFVRLASGKYEVWQVKRYGAITASDVKAIIDAFRAGTWVTKTEKLVLAVQASLADTKVQDAIEREAAALKEIGIALIPCDGEKLSVILRGHPELVDDFFGRGWVKAFLGPEAAAKLGARLDGAEFAHVREQLCKYYDAHFHLLDVGVALPLASGAALDAAPSLLRRFTMPDVLIRETIFEEQRTARSDNRDESFVDVDPASAASSSANAGPLRRRDYVRRAPLTPWLSEGRQLAVVGEAGSGKSTLLRCIALDVLIDQTTFPEFSRRWGALLPVHISFSKWSRLSASLRRAAGLKEVVAEVLQPALTADIVSLLDRAIDERRILLLLDGLDEWSDEQAARTTLQHILAFVATHDVPVVGTARPRGLDKIGSVPRGWNVAELAPLSAEQQRKLAEVWFDRTTARASSRHQSTETRAPIEARLDRFFADLGRDRRLSVLAGNPLLLVGLVALSLRQIALPRNKTQAVESLIGILIETHPEQRATEAGDTQSRFVSIQDADERRSALARLAFVARSASGGGTYELKEAKRAIKDYLADSSTFAYPRDRAQRAAEELLAVNAETVGLLAERAPGEVGFAHAVFEEFLAGEHIRSWPFPDIVSFVKCKSGEPLWRNVISTLMSLLTRPTEIQDLVATIECARAEDTSRGGMVSRDVLLADIAFGPSRKPPVTAQRLIQAAFDTIERGDWMLARREVLKSALTNLGDMSFTTSVDDRMLRWAPRREKYLHHLFDALSTWAPTPELEAALVGGLYDEERSTQRSAARALARAFGGRVEVQKQLRAILKKTLDLSVAAAVLEALSIGWPNAGSLSDLHDQAVASLDPTLRLVGISGRAASGRADTSDRDALVALLTEFPEIDFWDRPSARGLLSQHWQDDPALIKLALIAVRRSGHRRRELERETAMHYLVRCSASNQSVADWIRQELKEKYPFSLAHDEIWNQVVPFAMEHGDIRAAVIAAIGSEWGSHNLHNFQGLILALRDNELRDTLIATARAQQGWGAFWTVRPLVEGWGRADPIVASFLDEVVAWDNTRLSNLASILPQIIPAPEICKARLFALAKQPGASRFDLIATGFASLGCTGEDMEVVDILVAQLRRRAPLFDPALPLLAHFASNARVRQYAVETLKDRDTPLAALASAFKDDPQIRSSILTFANPLPATLRGDMADAASGDAIARSCLNAVLEDYDIEVDGELKIAASIYYHRALVRQATGPSEEHLAKLHRDVQAVGPDLNERRAAALAGLLILGRVTDVVPMIEYGDKPLNIRSGTGHGRESDSLMALMAERWEELSAAFETDLAARFGDFGVDEGHLWDCLAPHLNASPAVRRDFLNFADRTDTTLGLKSFLALARELASSDVLLRHCWRVFGREVSGRYERHSPWAVERIQLEIAYILRDQYRDRPDVVSHLQEAIERSERSEVVALSLLNPTDPLLDQIQLEPLEIGRRHLDWVTALHLASVRSTPEDFVGVVLAMINRPWHTNWDFQEVANRAVVERLARDAAAVVLLKSRLMEDATASEIASLPRYLSAAGALDAEVVQRCTALLQQEAQELIPRAGYDAVDDSIRAVSRSLLEVVTPPFSA
jgi:energy-coupling factor transporter ATP-binding protein EcfA2